MKIPLFLTISKFVLKLPFRLRSFAECMLETRIYRFADKDPYFNTPNISQLYCVCLAFESQNCFRAICSVKLCSYLDKSELASCWERCGSEFVWFVYRSSDSPTPRGLAIVHRRLPPNSSQYFVRSTELISSVDHLCSGGSSGGKRVYLKPLSSQ